MKKILICLAVFVSAGIALNKNSYAGCEESIPNTLQACFNSIQMNAISVVVSGSICTVTGPTNLLSTPAASACVDEYNTAAASCAGCPTLWFVVTSGSTNGGVGSTRPKTPIGS